MTGAILNADLAGSIADSKLSQITTASKVHGSSITGLASVPSGAGVLPIANIASGTPDGTKFVRDDGTLVVPPYPNLSNIIFQYIGNAEQQGASEGEYTGTSLNPTAATGNYRYLQTKQTSYTTVALTKWTKISGVSTVTVHCRIWCRTSGGAIASLKVDIGGANNTVDGTTNQITPEWKSFAIDVSGLVNGTDYTITIQLKNAGTGTEVFCSNYVGIGS